MDEDKNSLDDELDEELPHFKLTKKMTMMDYPLDELSLKLCTFAVI